MNFKLVTDSWKGNGQQKDFVCAAAYGITDSEFLAVMNFHLTVEF